MGAGTTTRALITQGTALSVPMSITLLTAVGATAPGLSSALPGPAEPEKRLAALPAVGIQRRKPLKTTS